MHLPFRRPAASRTDAALPRLRNAALGVTTAVALLASGVAAAPAFASSVTSAVFSGSAGTASNGGTLYAKQGATLTLTVTTSSDTQCVDVAGAFSAHQESAAAKTTWTFATTAPAGDSVQTVTAAASSMNKQGHCTSQSTTVSGSYTADNTGPVVTGALTPAANLAGWNKDNVTVNWTAADAGSGVSATQPFKTDSVNSNGIVTLTAPAQTDRLGNTGAAGSVTVRVDKGSPTITATQTKNADGTTTITFTCDDRNPGGQVSGIASCLADGSTSNSKTVQPGVTVTGTATDNAGNTATASSTAPAGDTTAPTLSGAPTTPANSNGYYTGDVTIHWTASDPQSGIPSAPADTTITGEGNGLTSTTTVKNGAGLTTTATSSPAVNIDRHAPTTGISGTSNNWINGNVNVSLSATDNLSGVDTTSYSIDGGADQTGTSFRLSTDGDHTISFFSTDKAGNVEAAQIAHVKIDKTAPTISHTFTPLSYTDGAWTNQDVTVTFTCADQGGSGVAGCTTPVTQSTETDASGAGITGTATDGAGSTATDTANVRIDKTKPTISAQADREPNTAGWYNDDVTVQYTASDALSGISGTPKADVLGEGGDQSASATVTDAAGNSNSAGVSGINVDKTAPTLTASFSSGWHTDDVTVSWTCTDALSGPAAQPADSTVTGEGDNLSATASCTDLAGNTTTKTVTGIEIDRTAPTTTVSVPKPNDNGWYGDDVTVTLTGSDNGSGIDTTYYSVDGGDPTNYDGAFAFGTEGSHQITFWSTDVAGNTETAGAPLTLKVDKTAPSTTVINPISPDSGWFATSGIPFAFTATDNGSGVAATYFTIDGGARQTYGEPFTQNLNDGTHTIAYWSVDNADNAEAHATTNTVTVNIDTTPPTISGSQTPAANGFGWNNTDVNVHFTCADTGSGIPGVAGCAGDTTLTNDGAGQMVPGQATDLAGNTTPTVFGPVNIDRVKPTLVGVPDDANGAGWHNGDVNVKWVGDDALSGIDPATQPGDSTIVGEGSSLGAGPVTISDKAGNTSDAASVTGIKIDRTAPLVAGAPTTDPNGAGWYKSAVTVNYTCSDPDLKDGTKGSGVALCPTSTTLSSDGGNQIVTSDGATDLAGNTGSGTTVGGINIDGTAPSTTANNRCTTSNGWCTGSTANVVLTARDQLGLSGVKAIHYRIDSGAEQVVANDTATVSVPLTGTGVGTVTYWAVDNAGNVEKANGVSLKWDNIAPTVTHTLSPDANAAGWNNATTTVTFSARDDDNGSGVDATTLTAPVTVSQETTGQVVDGSAKDTAGNVGTDAVTVKLDKTAPTITGAITSGTKGSNGWYVGPVTVTFTCSDALSGIPATACPSPVTVSDNGSNLSASGTVFDSAGNSASTTVTGINIDQEKPTLTTAGVNVQGGSFALGSVPTATCTATDTYSGIGSCTVTVTGGNANGVGTFTYTATATDNAGNTTTITGTYKVTYRWDGFLQPINDTAHQIGTSISVFKAGSTVPVKFQLKNASGTIVKAVAAPEWLNPVKGTAMTVPVNDTATTASVDSGSAFTYDSSSGQYQYNWKTPSTGGNWYSVGVKLDDGTTRYVTIGLK